MVNKQRLLQQFIDLVTIDSETGDERRIADYLLKKFSDLGLEVLEDNSLAKTGHGAGNLIATFPASSPDIQAPIIFFTSHMDTVAPGVGIKPIVDQEYIFSDGTTILGADDKAGIAAMLEAVQVLKENQLPHGELQFILTVGEESGLKGSRNLQKELVRAEYGFALDSNGVVGKIIIGAPIQAKVNITVFGKTAHAGVNPEDGISAIQVASHAIAKMKHGRIDSETTANIGKFHGETATNVVCDKVEITAEARSLKDEKLYKQLEHMQEVFQDTAEQFKTRIDFAYEIMYPAYSFEENAPIVKKAVDAVKALGREPELTTSGGGSDANVLNGYNLPTLNLGVGYERIHTTAERQPIAEFMKITELLIELIKQNS